MTSKKFLVSLVAILAVAIAFIASVSAISGTISDLEVNGVDMLGATTPQVIFAGQTIPVKITFSLASGTNAQDVRVKAWIAGDTDLTSVSERFDAIGGNTYSRTVAFKVPANLKELDEFLALNVAVESRTDGTIVDTSAPLTLERESYIVEVLDVNMPGQVSAGDIVPLDVVLKNRGMEFAEDTFVEASIPALGIGDRAYFADLSSIDEPFSSNPFEANDRTLNGDRLSNQDSAERRLFLRIPSNAPAGVYVVEVKAFNGDTESTITRKVVIAGSEANTMVVAPIQSKTFKVGETADYDLVLVNSGNQLKVFQLAVESPSGLTVTVSEPVVALSAGASKTVKISATSAKEGTQVFTVNVHSGSQLVGSESFTASVEGTSGISSAGNSAVLLTVVLAVIFVVLLIVLIVLLTRKPVKTEEFGESYY